MSMEISSNYKDYKNEYLDRVQTGQDKVKEASQDQRGEDKNEGIPVPKDEYISSEKSGSKPSGLYRLGQDENGNPKVMYDDPKRVAKAKDVQPKEEPAKKAEKCTTNTDNVDREIEKLKEEKEQLEQQIKAAAGDKEKVKVLEKMLFGGVFFLIYPYTTTVTFQSLLHCTTKSDNFKVRTSQPAPDINSISVNCKGK